MKTYRLRKKLKGSCRLRRVGSTERESLQETYAGRSRIKDSTRFNVAVESACTACYDSVDVFRHTKIMTQRARTDGPENENALSLKFVRRRAVSCEIVFLTPRSNRQTQTPPPAVDGFDRVQHVITLGVTLCHNFCMSKHIDTVITSCARTLYGLRTLHCVPKKTTLMLHTIDSTHINRFR